MIGDCKTEARHVKLTTPSIKKGVPTYIDAVCLLHRGARSRVAKNTKHQVFPFHSPLRAASHRNRLAEVAPLNLGVIYGCASLRMDGLIHAISAAQHVFGGGVKSVQCLSKANDVEAAKLYYGDEPGKPSGGVILTREGAGGSGDVTFSFYAAALGKHGAIQSEPQNDYTHPHGMRCVVEKIRAMARTGKSPMPMSEMLENIAVADAIRKAYRTGHPASVEAMDEP